MPNAIEVYKDHADNRDKFEIIAIHDSSVDSFEELDKKLPRLKEQYWKGQDLPFPVMIDKDETTENAYGISAHPTQVLIDPEGNVVGMGSLELLEKKLPKLPAGVIWKRNADSQKNVQWGWGPNPKFKELTDAFKLWGGKLEIEIAPEIVEEFGLQPDAELPFYMEGYGVTLRSLAQLAFEPYGLSLQPNADGTGLALAKDSRTDVPETELQKRNNAALREKIATDPSLEEFAEEGESEEQAKVGDLVIKELSLRKAMSRISNQFEIPVGINKAALEKTEGKLASGKISAQKMKASISDMLEPLGVKLIVKYEMLLVVPKE